VSANILPHSSSPERLLGPQPLPLLVELTGPAGAGKTTLLRALASRRDWVQAGVRLDRVRDLPAVAWAATQIAPSFCSALLRGSPTAREDAHYSLRLSAYRAAAARARRVDCRLVLMDEGPVYMLARLRGFGSAGREGAPFEQTWRRGLEWWRSQLDAIVWLDAPDSTLAARIRSRTKEHRFKNSSDAALHEFLTRYRFAYATVIACLTAGGGPRVICLDGAEPMDLAVDRLLAALPIRSGGAGGLQSAAPASGCSQPPSTGPASAAAGPA
jgi:hypothetical protein